MAKTEIEPADLDPPPEYLRQGPPLFPARTGEGIDWRRAIPMGVAIVTLVAFAAGMWFAYGQGMRKGLETTPPPLVRADSGPTKIAPVDPGGFVAPNQDKQVFDAVAAQPAPRVEHLLPPPEAPMAAPAPIAAVPEPLPVVETPQPTTLAAREAAAPVGAPAVLAPPVLEPVTVAEPMPAPIDVAANTAVPPKDTVAAPRPIVPVTTPATPPGNATRPVAAVTPPAATPPRPATPAAAGTYRVQLGAYGDPKAALEGWTKLQKANTELLKPLEPIVVVADVNGRTVQRLQAGPLANQAAATQLCADLKAKGADCLVVKP